MNQNFDVVALGELLVDFTESGMSPQGNPLFEANPGGAPCNVLAMLGKLGRKTAFIGKVGADAFGVSLRRTCEEAGICMDHLGVDPRHHTTLAFVQTAANGDRSFSFSRNPGADQMLSSEDIPEEMIAQAGIFHFGSLSLTHEPSRSATCKAVEIAKKNGVKISFDPNLRPPLWDSLEDAKAQIEWGLRQSDVVKIADDELKFLTGEDDFDLGAAALRSRFPNIRLFNVTAGAEGSYSYYETHRVYVPSFRLGGTIETTGAGDTFCACVLHFVLEHGLDGLTETDLREMLRFANAAAYLVTTKKGAIRSMPAPDDVNRILKTER